MNNEDVIYRQPIFCDGKFVRFHHWGYCGYQGEFVAPLFHVNPDSGYELKDNQRFTGFHTIDKNLETKDIYEGDRVNHACLMSTVVWEESEARFRLVRDGKQGVQSEPLTLGILAQIQVMGHIYKTH
jgi:hypothetical protein